MQEVINSLPETNLVESIILARNPYSVVLRARVDGGNGHGGFVAALTDRFDRFDPPLQTMPHVRFIIGTPEEEFTGNLDPVSREEWPKFRDTINRDARYDPESVHPFSFPPDLSYEDMLVRGTRCFLDHYEAFEAISFPTKFIFGTGTYCSPRSHHVSFREYYHHASHQLTHNPIMHATWNVWSLLIIEGLEIIKQRALAGTLDERRHVPFLSPEYCIVCGSEEDIKHCQRCKLIAYCGRDHQTQDWAIHRKCCKKAKFPGCPI